MSNSIKVHILTPPLQTQNVRGFLSPIIINNDLLREIGVNFEIFNKVENKLTECDHLMVNAKFFGEDWNYRPQYIIDTLENIKQKNIKIFYCDNYDSTAPIRS